MTPQANPFDMPADTDVAWCPGCGNFGINDALKKALVELGKEPADVCIVSGIGQAAKNPHYVKSHFFNGLHGRALPVATAVKAANPALTVIAEGGDGDMYAEGGNHFLHAIRRNPDVANLVHNNMVYGLTKGQASPTSLRGYKTPVQVAGVIAEPFNPLAVAIALDASFVARTYIGSPDHAKEVFKRAIEHRGYALVDVFQPCPSFNKLNTYEWFAEHTYVLGDDHDPGDRTAAFSKATETGKYPIGVFYETKDKPVFEDQLEAFETVKQPLYQRTRDRKKIKELLAKTRE